MKQQQKNNKNKKNKVKHDINTNDVNSMIVIVTGINRQIDR